MSTVTIDPEFLELMPIRVDIARYTGTDSWGNNTYAAAVTVRARREQPTKTMLTALADAGAAMANPGDFLRLIIDYVSPGWTQRDRVTINGSAYTIVSAITEDDENGPYYQDLTLRNNQER